MAKAGWIIKKTNTRNDRDYYFLKKGYYITRITGETAVTPEETYRTKGHAQRQCDKQNSWDNYFTSEPYEVRFDENGKIL